MPGVPHHDTLALPNMMAWWSPIALLIAAIHTSTGSMATVS